MLGFQLFVHSFKLVILNLKQALKLSIPMILPWCLGVIFLQFVRPYEAVSRYDFGNIFAVGALFGVVLSIGLVWTAVGWHRYVLLEDRGSGVLPRFHSQLFPYIWRSLALGLSLGLIFALASALTGSLGFSVGGIWLSMLLLFVVGALLNWSFYLLSPILPAAALGKKMTFAEAWDYTEDFAGSIAIVALCYFALGYILEYFVDFVGALLPTVVYFGLLGIVSWLLAMLGISLLTTIYGVAVENREL